MSDEGFWWFGEVCSSDDEVMVGDAVRLSDRDSVDEAGFVVCGYNVQSVVFAGWCDVLCKVEIVKELRRDVIDRVR